MLLLVQSPQKCKSNTNQYYKTRGPRSPNQGKSNRTFVEIDEVKLIINLGSSMPSGPVQVDLQIGLELGKLNDLTLLFFRMLFPEW